MYNQNTIHSTEHHQSIISDHRRRFTEIHGDTQAFVKLLRSGGCQLFAVSFKLPVVHVINTSSKGTMRGFVHTYNVLMKCM